MEKLLAVSLATALLVAPAAAKEGMYTPSQIPEIADDLREAGLRLDPQDLASLTDFPMGAIVIVGGCTGSFVSPQGLVATNHHCARSQVQYISTKERNYLVNGFLASSLGQEPEVAPGSRLYVTVAEKDVTQQVTGGLNQSLADRARYEEIEDREQALVRECEADKGHRCRISAFFGGLQYKLIKQLEIRDLRLVYAPADMVGRFGGDIDNWQWPRHTGDFSFFRAYVAPDGSPADYAKENVPYQPEHHLKVSAKGIEEGDFVMAAGYPGSTSRYSRLAEVRNTFGWRYPVSIELWDGWIKTIEEATPRGSAERLKYESGLAGINNGLKNLRGQLEGARRVDLVRRRAEREAALDAWIAADSDRARFAHAIDRLDDLTEATATVARRNFWYGYATNPRLLGIAQRLYRLSRERQLPDDGRESGFQERDMLRFKQRLQGIDQSYDAAVDKAEWLYFIERYMAQPPELRVQVLDAALGLHKSFDRAAIKDTLEGYYSATVLNDEATRIGLMGATPAELEANDDPFIQLAVALYETEIAHEEEEKTRIGEIAILRPRYMEAIIDWQRAQGKVTYPDANSTLRVTYGHVVGGSPEDGLIYEPFTRLEGILAKDTGEDPFNSPHSLLERIRAKQYGGYALDAIGTIPVNFLSDLDITGGNSGTATLNARGELVGLLFDSTLASVNSDWYYNARTDRTIHVDSRYMLWVMDQVDGADRLIAEMEVVR